MGNFENPKMAPVWSRSRWAFTLTTLVAGATVAGCGGPTGQFFIIHNQVPEAGCVVPADKSAPYRGEGILDVRVPSALADTAYELFPLLENDLPAEAGDGVQPTRIALSGFDIDITFVDGSAAATAFFTAMAADPAMGPLVRYQAPWSGSVDAGGGVTSALTNGFPNQLAKSLRDGKVLADGSYLRVDVNVRAFGNTLSGSVKSDVFTYPMRVCDGCLINSITACPTSGPVLTGGVCNPGQDAPVDCCTQGADLVCPATSAP
jgi:hypothetical protein